MRIGNNPHKDKEHKIDDYLHQVIIPVYIPNLEGYFKESLEVFKMCIESLLKTVHEKTFVTIVNNGSCDEVCKYIEGLIAEGKIHEVIHSINIGKLNSILKGLVGNDFPLVTIADSDVLFCNGWQKATLAVFNNFPKAGVVGLTPQFKTFENCCGNVIFENLFSKSMKFSKVKDSEALERFYESIGWDKSYNQDYLAYNLTIESGTCSALIGCGHFVATYKKSLFENITSYIGYKMGGDSEGYLDVSPLKKGLWRLCTSKNYAYHMGNHIEKWMDSELNSKDEKNEISMEVYLKISRGNSSSAVQYYLKNRLFVRLFSNKTFKRMFYKAKGLPKEMIETY